MKLLTFVQDGATKLGVKYDREKVLDVARAAASVGSNSDIPLEVHSVINKGSEAIASLQQLLDQVVAKGDDHADYWLNEESLQFAPCVTHPNKIICVGLNYRKHAEETNSPIPEYPILFNKFHNTLAAHQADIAIPKVTEKLDYEVELCIVIGKNAKYVSKEDALGHVFGYCAVNDLSARDLQLRTPQWMLGKVGDGFSPLGPYLVTSDEIADPNNLNLKTTVNGEVRQNSNTSDMIFRCDEIVSYISQYLTLVPGDIILTGTPEGVVMGYPPEKQVYLQPGDVVTVEVENLGSLTNRFVAE